jgi:hypothetical protein
MKVSFSVGESKYTKTLGIDETIAMFNCDRLSFMKTVKGVGIFFNTPIECKVRSVKLVLGHEDDRPILEVDIEEIKEG